MPTWSFDLDAAMADDRIDVEVMLALETGGNEARILARPHWFPDEKGNTSTLGWQCTVTGRRIDYARPYAWTEAPEPPSLTDEPPVEQDPQLPLEPPAEEVPPDEIPPDDIDQRLPPELAEVDF